MYQGGSVSSPQQYYHNGVLFLDYYHNRQSGFVSLLQFVTDKKDDYIGSFMWNNKRIEVLLADKQESFQNILAYHKNNDFATIAELFCIKSGHIHSCKRQDNFNKHIHDYHYLKNMIDYVFCLHQES